MHDITPFWDEKFINFLRRGTAPPQTHLLRRVRRLDSRVFGARPATPHVPVALTPMVDVRGVNCYLDSTELSSNKYSEHIQFSKFSSATSGLSRRESSSHCWHLRDETGQFCCVGSGNVNWHYRNAAMCPKLFSPGRKMEETIASFSRTPKWCDHCKQWALTRVTQQQTNSFFSVTLTFSVFIFKRRATYTHVCVLSYSASTLSTVIIEIKGRPQSHNFHCSDSWIAILIVTQRNQPMSSAAVICLVSGKKNEQSTGMNFKILIRRQL